MLDQMADLECISLSTQSQQPLNISIWENKHTDIYMT